jgi:hypothetical protein
MRSGPFVAAAVLSLSAGLVVVLAQRPDAFVVSRDHPAIQYSTRPTHDRISRLNRQIQEGEIRLTFDGPSGYLRSTLQALEIPIESQVTAFAANSFQGSQIGPKNPRAVFFADSVAVGWVRGGSVLEAAAHDPEQGVIFYALDQQAAATPEFKRNDGCLACHLSWDTLGVPGFFVLSSFPLPEDKNAYANGFASDHRQSLELRWGGWYVTGHTGVRQHMGNLLKPAPDPPPPNPELKSLEGLFDLSGYPTAQSDVVALMVLEHQAHMTNLLTRVAWEARLAKYEDPSPDATVKAERSRNAGEMRVRDAVRDLVDYLLFVDEAPLGARVEGSSGFAARFQAQGPRDRSGRSLRQLDLERRLLRYPCSYMIYTDAFDALPVKDLVYQRMWQILSGEDKDRKYARKSAADKQAIVEILRETKKDLPEYFKSPSG